MTPVPNAFLTPVTPSFRPNILARPVARTCSTRNYTVTASAALITAEVAIAAAASGGAFYLFKIRKKPTSAKAKPETKVKDSKSPKPLPPLEQNTEAVIGLVATNGNFIPSQPEPPAKESGAPYSVPYSGPYSGPSPVNVFDTAGVDLDRFVPKEGKDGFMKNVTAERFSEELAFISGSLLDLEGCAAVAIVDPAGKLILADGDYIDGVSSMGEGVQQVRQTGQKLVLDVDNNSITPFFTQDVRNVAILPIGDSGAVIVIGSAQPFFFGEKVNRVATSTVARLAPFMTKLNEIQAVDS